MKKIKLIVSLMLCMAMVCTISISAFADNEIAPLANPADATHYVDIGGYGLHYGPSLNFHKMGILAANDECHIIPDDNGRILVDDEMGRAWAHVYMDSGRNVDKVGYTYFFNLVEFVSACK